MKNPTRFILDLREAATAEAIGRGQTGRIFCKCEKGCTSNPKLFAYILPHLIFTLVL